MTERCCAEIAENIKRITHEIEELCISCGRDPKTASLMAVTKTQPPEAVDAALRSGITLLGENRAQELTAKFAQYETDASHIHFIGHLQSNKVRQIIDQVSVIQSVDRLGLAREIDRCAQNRNITMPVLVEVNIGGEQSKSGISTEQLDRFIEELSQFMHIRVEGLMCIPPVCDNSLQAEKYFERMHRHFIDIKAKKLDNINMQLLSMGMSNDYAAAIRQHSNIIRIGRAIFGDRR